MSSKLAGLLLSLALVPTTVWAEEKPCTARDGDQFYDLNPLQNSKDYEFSSSSGRTFVMNVCKSVVREPWNIDSPENIGMSFRGDHGDFSTGSLNTTLEIRHSHPLLTLTNGSPCPQLSSMRASTAVRFICDTSVFAAGNPQLVAQLPPDDADACAFFVEWRTHHACPTAEKGEAFGVIAIFAVLLMMALLTYIIGGTLYNRFVLKLRGVDQIPRFSFISITRTLDFFRSCSDRVRSQSSSGDPRSWGIASGWGRDRAGFERVPSSFEDQEGGMFGSGQDHRFSLDDDDDDDDEAGLGQTNDRTHAPPTGMNSDGFIRL